VSYVTTRYDCRLTSSGRESLDNLRSMVLVGDPNSEPVALIWPGYELTRQLALRAIECRIRRLHAYDTVHCVGAVIKHF